MAATRLHRAQTWMRSEDDSIHAILSGTNRPGSATRHFACALLEIYESLGVNTTLVDLAAIPEDAWSGKYYGDDAAIKHPAIREAAHTLSEADSLSVVTPEYNGGMPGALKLFIDLLPHRDYNLVGLPVSFVGVAAGDWGGLRPVEQLESIFLYRKAFLFPERVLVRRCDEALDADGNITDAQIRRRLEGQAQRFARFADQLKPLQSIFHKGANPAALEHPEVLGA